ncbi:TetR/AcrR family transcriptional regulator [Amorphoplanes digitatis]|uniref:AcrR family transcriptional regulator n=1 Tax=Actinoplanes digitatis TaxID=1868 RepID=A0A7W7MS08_9ACTN|nr:TetR/AcrR family transcriptional regulator [Actinoplanes digitatis]MBB4764858.1 AcrR family transcriptional regulator [Actinoplanes digitatis]GID91186.1 TetR family transcriptional regulator [Actinoplanes digitatis]
MPQSPATTQHRLDPGREQAILDAVRDLLAEVGYDRMTIDEVARRARASKATIYRRWSGKPGMVAAALHGMMLEHPPLADTGSLRGDLIAALNTFCRVYERKQPIVLSLLSAIRTDPDLGRLLHEHVLETGVADAEFVFARAVARGELAGPPDAGAVIEVCKALLWHRLLLSGESLDEPWVIHVVDSILRPMLGHPGNLS